MTDHLATTVGDVDTIMTQAFQCGILLFALTTVFVLRHRIWNTSRLGQWWPAAIAGLVLYLASTTVVDGLYQPGPGWYSQPLTSGWQVTRVTLNYIIGSLTVAAWCTIAALAWVVAHGTRVWLETPQAEPWTAITNAEQLRRDWRLWRYEQRLTKSLAAHVVQATPDHCATITRQRICTPNKTETWFLISPPFDDIAGLRPIVVDTPMVQHADPINGSDGLTRIRVTWDSAALIRPRRRHVMPRCAGLSQAFRAVGRFGVLRSTPAPAVVIDGSADCRGLRDWPSVQIGQGPLDRRALVETTTEERESDV